MDYSKVLHKIDHLRSIGGVLFTEYKAGIMLAALLLFLSMIGSIVMTLDSIVNINKKTLKSQDANHQSMRSYDPSNQIYRVLLKK